MKKIIITALMLAAVSATTYATGTNSNAGTYAATTEEDKTPVDPSKLPDAVKATLAGDAYKDWKVSNAWQVKADPVYYTVELKKDDKTTTVNIDANGKVK